ncbi:hypothetical protein OS493_030959 [Desmophyllum pertusum]|uniref:G-protein coupled receptors family 1 profile domain-containing protein n=1 Tax=Desmophyllum pertusum TaxID=174260 RepID=A0A9W9ZK14_9CNID|nr:hypothetical protein OS493_030959 [Desmophyllum pertusum]
MARHNGSIKLGSPPSLRGENTQIPGNTSGVRNVRKLTLMMGIVVIVYYISWFPFLLNNMVCLIVDREPGTKVVVFTSCDLSSSRRGQSTAVRLDEPAITDEDTCSCSKWRLRHLWRKTVLTGDPASPVAIRTGTKSPRRATSSQTSLFCLSNNRLSLRAGDTRQLL